MANKKNASKVPTLPIIAFIYSIVIGYMLGISFSGNFAITLVPIAVFFSVLVAFGIEQIKAPVIAKFLIVLAAVPFVTIVSYVMLLLTLGLGF